LSDIDPVSTSYDPGESAPEGFIPLCVPEIRGNEWKYLKECLDTNWVSSAGPFVDHFERMVAECVGTKFAVATMNGTTALHVALMVAGVQPDDEVLVSTLTFIAPANAIRYVGAWPVFIDADPNYWQMDPERVVDFLEKTCHFRRGKVVNKTTGRRVKAILPVHILGHPCDMDPIMAAAQKFELVVIEDASESLGAQYKGRPVGRLGDIACFSFNGNKIITTGGGGMIVTDNEAWARRARYLTTQAKDDPVEFIHREVGYNYRMTNLQAAMGCAQLEQIESYIASKRSIAAAYQKNLSGVPGVTLMPEAPWALSIFWLYTIAIDPVSYGLDSRQLLRRLNEARIQVRPLWQPIHRSPAHSGFTPFGCKVADELNRKALSLPSSVGLSEDDQSRVVDALRDRIKISTASIGG